MPNENTIEIINQNYIIEIDTPQYSIFTENTINIDYNYAVGKPQINSVELNGNKSAKDLGLVDFSDIELKENISNKVTVLDENSTDIEYPSAKCVNDLLQLKVNTDLSNLSEQGQAKFDAKADKSELNNKANKDLNNVVEIAEGSLVDNELKNKLNNQQITNCLLEVPQKIKLELNDGVLTLKAGSKVIVPNGFEADGTTPKFDYLTIESDITYSIAFTSSVPCYALYHQVSKQFMIISLDDSNIFYDQTINKVTHTNVSGLISFPIALVVRDTTGIGSIDQIFNGFGYIGSTIWADKGVKVLIPDGRNEDGSLKNIEHTLDKVCLVTNAVAIVNGKFVLTPHSISQGTAFLVDGNTYSYQEHEPTTVRWYKPSANMFYRKANEVWVEDKQICIGEFSKNTTNITSFEPKQPFRAVDYSDKSEISSWGMPSDKSVDLTLGASGTTYTAPANGWLVFGKRVGATTAQYILLINVTANMRIVDTIKGDINNELGAYLPVNKGDKVRVDYNATGETTSFKFHYAEGEV